MGRPFIFLAVAITVLAVGLISLGTVVAEEEQKGSEKVNTVARVVAESLGLYNTDGGGKPKFHRKPTFEGIEKRLQDAVENGKLSQAQANEKLKWFIQGTSKDTNSS